MDVTRKYVQKRYEELLAYHQHLQLEIVRTEAALAEFKEALKCAEIVEEMTEKVNENA